MSLVTTKDLMLDAQKNHYAIGAFNAENMEMVQAIIAAAEELRAPVIVQTTPGTLKYASPAMFHAMVAAAASEASVPVVMHLDHGSSYELAMQAFRAGYTSVMIDGSHHVFEENIEITKSVVRACHAAGIPVEAELGKVGGKEDDLDGGNGNGYTVPSEAAEFAERTGVDSLAVAIGTAHGVYKGTPKLDMERLSEIRKVVSVPLVLHRHPPACRMTLSASVSHAVCARSTTPTDLRIAFSKGLNGIPRQGPRGLRPQEVQRRRPRVCQGICQEQDPGLRQQRQGLNLKLT